MVTFDRRYRSVRKGYSRESVKRDTEVVLEQELSGRGLPDAVDDRGVAGLVFGWDGERELDEGPRVIEVSPPIETPPAIEIEIETERAAVVEPEPPKGGRIRRWLRGLFG